MDLHYQPIEKVLQILHSSVQGLSDQEARQRLQKAGKNCLQEEKKINLLVLFLSQFKNFIIYILLFAVFFSLLIHEYIDSVIILAILIVNSLIGFFQELSAGNSLRALKKMSAVNTKVYRDNDLVVLNADYLVPGDIIVLETGDIVPADARIIESAHLKAEEASLTGESVPVEKSPAPTSQHVQLGDRHNMLFSSTSIVSGNCRALITATGIHTEIGRISMLLSETQKEMTPLQRRLDLFGRKLGMVILLVCVLVFVLSMSKEYLLNGISVDSLVTFAFIAISLAVAAVPTAMPAVVTIALSIGVKRLLKKKALVRRLSAVETLGSCDVICTDKTGTLTQNIMTVKYGWTPDGEVNLTSDVVDTSSRFLFEIGIYCNNSHVHDKGGDKYFIGDPTETALLVSARKIGVHSTLSRKDRKDELVFDSQRKLMSVLVHDEGSHFVYTKGAPAELLDRCAFVLQNSMNVPLTNELRQSVLSQNEIYSRQSLRVLGFAFKKITAQEQFDEENLVFVGLQAMSDPPRPEVIEAVKKTAMAGIRIIMITGDYSATAKAIGREIGIDGEVVNGQQLEAMNQDQLIESLENKTNIFARVSPEHKQRIVTALQQMNHTVAMTGDGVNDAPALKKANIGIAVGSGTEVAKQEADFVLLDDSFSHIVNAIEEGRGIYDNIQKSIMLLLSGNLGEVLIIFIAIILGFNLPLTAILLLWINMVTDGAPALAYSVDPYGADIMKRPPKPAQEGLLPWSKLRLISVMGGAGTIIALLLFVYFGGESGKREDLVLAQTIVFNFIVLYELILTFVIRMEYKVPFWANRWIWAAVLVSVMLQGLLMYTPLHKSFNIVPLGGFEIGVLMGGGACFYLFFLLYQGIIHRLPRCD